MIGPLEKGISYFLLLLILALPAVAVQAQQKDDPLVVALQEAREAGISETMLNRLLALGYEKQVEPAAMGNLLTILTQSQLEQLPLQPFLSKIEEGLAKKVSASRIEQVLRNKLADYRFTQELLAKFMERQGQAGSISPEYRVRLTETLSCGVSREDLAQLLEESPAAPLPVVTRGAEVLASLKQLQFDPKLSEQIVDTGVKQGYFTEAPRDFARIIAVAREKGLDDSQITRATLEVIERGRSQADLLSQLGINTPDLDRHGPQLGKSNQGLGKTRDTDSVGAPAKGLVKSPSGTSSSAASSGTASGASSGTGVSSGTASGGSSGTGVSSGATSSGTSNSAASSGTNSNDSSDGSSGATSGGSSGSGSDSSSASEKEASSAPAETEQPQQHKSIRFTAAGLVAHFSPAALTMKLDIEKANRVLKGRIGKVAKFAISDKVKVRAEGSEPGVFDLDLTDIKAGESSVRVLGKKLAGSRYLITHIVVCLNEEGPKQKKKNTPFTAFGTATDIDPAALTMTVLIETADDVLGERIGDTVTFAVSEKVTIKEESPNSSVFGLSLDDITAGAGYLKVIGKELAGGYLVTQIVVVLDE
jgi:hypothetical protein